MTREQWGRREMNEDDGKIITQKRGGTGILNWRRFPCPTHITSLFHSNDCVLTL